MFVFFKNVKCIVICGFWCFLMLAFITRKFPSEPLLWVSSGLFFMLYFYLILGAFSFLSWSLMTCSLVSDVLFNLHNCMFSIISPTTNLPFESTVIGQNTRNHLSLFIWLDMLHVLKVVCFRQISTRYCKKKNKFSSVLESNIPWMFY